MATSLNQDDYVKTALRLPRELHAEIAQAANAAGKSLNSEMLDRLSSQRSIDVLADSLAESNRLRREEWNVTYDSICNALSETQAAVDLLKKNLSKSDKFDELHAALDRMNLIKSAMEIFRGRHPIDHT